MASVVNFINISASLAKAGELKLDTYFQAENNTPTYRALWAMFKAPVVPWSLKSVNALLTVPNDGTGLGYRACALKTGSSFTIQGEMGVGKSLVTQTDLKGNVIDIDFSAEISASHQHTITGDVSMFVTRHASSGKPLLKITIEETDERTNALNLALQAQIKGLDKLAGQYVEMLLSKGNKIVQWLEENSSPGAALLESLDSNVNKDKWYKPIASLALGQESVDDAVESLIGKELQNIIDRIPLSSEDDAEELADKPQRPLSEIISQPRFIVAVLCGTSAYALMSYVMTAAPLAMIACGFDVDDATWGIQWHVLAMFGPSFFTGHLIARFGKERIMATGLFILVACALVGLNGITLAHFYIGLILLGVGWNFGFIGATAMLTGAHRPSERGVVQGMNDLIVFGMVTVASLASGGLMNCSGGDAVQGWSAVNYAMLPFLVLAGASLVWLATLSVGMGDTAPLPLLMLTVLLCAFMAMIVFVGYAFLFSTMAASRFYISFRRPFDAVLGFLFGAAAIKILTARIA